MRGKIAVAVIVVLACALFLVPYASAAFKLKIIDTWVEGPSGERLDEHSYLDVKETCTYNVEVGMEGTSFRPQFFTANLAFGPNYGNINCQEYRTKDCEMKETTTTISFAGLSFLPLADCDDAFKEFVEGKRGWKWDTCWYKFDVESTRYEGAETEPIRGIPMLTRYEQRFDDPHVGQNRTLKGMTFDYSVFTWANINDSIMLQVWNHKNNRWDEKGLKEYPEPLIEQKLTWHAVALTSGNLDRAYKGKYRFVGSYNESAPFHGGHIGPTIKEEFYMPSVYYNKTISNLSFDYEVTTWVNMVEDNNILLEVWNFSDKSWELKGIRGYTEQGYNQTLRWTGINLSFYHFDDHLRGKYRFTGTYGESSPTDKGHQGPIIEETYDNLDVTPTQGTNIDTFNYSVTVNANVCDKIELQVKNHTTNLWDAKGTRDYRTPDIDETLTWQEIRLNTHEFDRFNDSTYKFVGISKSNESEGPFSPLNLSWRNHSVTPSGGFYNGLFDYCIEVKATKEINVTLRVDYPHEGEAVISDPTKRYTNRGNWEPICWNDTQPFDKEDEGKATYKFEFYYKGTSSVNETELYSDPSIGIADFKDEWVEPEVGTRETEFTYHVKAGTLPGESGILCLEIFDSSGRSREKVKSAKVTTSELEFFVFPNVTFGKGAMLGPTTYSYSIEGTNTMEWYDDGPKLIEEEFTSDLCVDPKKGTNTTLFDFNTNLSSSEKGVILVTLQVSSDKETWLNVANKSYDNINPGKPIPLNFTVSIDTSGIPKQDKNNLTTAWRINNKIYWQVKGFYSNTTIEETGWDIGLRCHDRTFSHDVGRWNDTFNFTVTLSAEIKGKVALKIKLNDSDSTWVTVSDKYIEDYNYTKASNPQEFRWMNVPVSTSTKPFEGDTWYNFTLLWDSGEDSCGPESGPRLFIPLDIQLKNAFVTPEVGVSYIENEILWRYFKNRNTNYTYCVNVSAAKDTRIRPVIIDPAGNRTTGYELGYSHGTKPGELCWNTSLSGPGDLCWGMWYYTFEYFDTRKEYETGDGWVEWQVQDGPEHLAVLTDFDIDPKPLLLYGESCNVSVVVNGSRDFDITLELWNATGCVQYKKKTYNSSKGEDRIRWEGIMPREKFSSSDKLLFNLNVSGEPSLEDVSGGFSMRPAARNPKVTPGDGYWDSSYNYSVEIKFDREIDVELGILHPNEGKYHNQGNRSYKCTSKDWETLYWNLTSEYTPFDRGCERLESRFNFTWNGTPLSIREGEELEPLSRIRGPYIMEPSPEVRFKNGNVSIKEATYEDELDYDVTVTATKDVWIDLWAYDPCSEWSYIDSDFSYSSIKGGWQNIAFSNLKPFYEERCKEGHSEFKFKAYYKGVLVNESISYSYPDLIPLIEFSNASVAPETGEYNTRYNYSVNITLNRPELVDISELKLMVWNPSTKSEEEYPSGNVTNLSDNIKKILWSETPFMDDKSCKGTAKYYFDYNGDIWPEKVLCDGPTIAVPTPKPSSGGGGGGGGSYGSSEKIYDNASVKPDPVGMGIIRESKTLNYSVEETKNYKLILEIYNVSSEKWEEKGEGVKSKHNGKWKHEWTVNLTLDCNWEGRGKYRFYPEKQGKYASQVYYGPDYELKLPGGSEDEWIQAIPVSNTPLAVPTITAKVEPEEGMWFKKFTYTANVKHPNKAKMTVALLVYKPGSDEWVPVAKGRQYNYIINTSDYDDDEQDKTTVRWTLDGGTVFDEGDARESQSGFYIWYWDGWNKIDCEKKQLEGYDEGPELLANHEPQIIKDPELNFLSGSTSTVFEYSFEVEDDVNDTVYGLLTVIDPLNNLYIRNKVEKTKKVENKTDGRGVASLRFIVDPDSDIFTEEKLKQYEKETGKDAFTSQYSLEYWDECREMIGIGKHFKTDKFTGPTVIAVDVKPTKIEVSPKEVIYADEFEITTEFYSSKENTISLDLTVYDPSNNNEICNASGYLKITSGNPKGNYSWKIKPVGLAYAGKTLNYSITWEDSFNTIKNISGSGPYIERAVPLLSWDRPLVPVVSMVLVPLVVIGISLLSVLSGVPVSSLLKRGFGNVRKKGEEGTEKKKEGEKGTEEKNEEAED